jgi:hypothetical protein
LVGELLLIPTTTVQGTTVMRKTVFALLAACATLAMAAPVPDLIYGPYKHLAMWGDATHVLTVAPHGVPIPYISGGRRIAGSGAVSWAFATGECGAERWGAVEGQSIADANVRAFEQAGVDYIVSTGGQGGVFTCASDEGMERFIARYESSRLIGLDFDIEAGQTEQQIESLMLRIKAAQQIRPHLRYSFTVATFGAADGSLRSLNAQAEQVLGALRRHQIDGFILNLMVMNYSPVGASTCVLRQGQCDMGRSAIQAARNVHQKYEVPYAQIGLTVMIGVNDVLANEFGIEDARMLAKEARSMQLAALHYWSLDRDRPCSEKSSAASPVCSGVALPSGQFERALSGMAQ